MLRVLTAKAFRLLLSQPAAADRSWIMWSPAVDRPVHTGRFFHPWDVYHEGACLYLDGLQRCRESVLKSATGQPPHFLREHWTHGDQNVPERKSDRTILHTGREHRFMTSHGHHVHTFLNPSNVSPKPEQCFPSNLSNVSPKPEQCFPQT